MPTTHGGSAAKNGISWLRVSLRATTISPFASTANLKHPLRQIETNPRDSRQIPDRLAHGRLPFRWVDDNDHLGTLMPFGASSTPSFAGDLRHRWLLGTSTLRRGDVSIKSITRALSPFRLRRAIKSTRSHDRYLRSDF